MMDKPTRHKSHPKYRNTGPQGSKKTENKKPASIKEIEEISNILIDLLLH
jgi:hypothetical protein